jgi:hypothetical protein
MMSSYKTHLVYLIAFLFLLLLNQFYQGCLSSVYKTFSQSYIQPTFKGNLIKKPFELFEKMTTTSTYYFVILMIQAWKADLRMTFRYLV